MLIDNNAFRGKRPHRALDPDSNAADFIRAKGPVPRALYNALGLEKGTATRPEGINKRPRVGIIYAELA